MWFVYALQSKKDGWLYIGMSSDVKKRLEEHNRGYNKSTRSRTPFELFYVEEVGTRKEAREREKVFERRKGRQFLRSRLAGK